MKSLDLQNGSFHKPHTQTLEQQCSSCHWPNNQGILFLRKDEPLPVGMPGPVDRKVCLSCHQAPGQPTPPPPYESVHRKAVQPGDLVVALNRFYDETGLAPVDQAVPAGHLGVELKFVALLCHAEMEAWQQERAGDARRVLVRQREFFGRHLLQWAPDYLNTVHADTQHAFYRCLAILAHKTMTEDQMAVEGRYVS